MKIIQALLLCLLSSQTLEAAVAGPPETAEQARRAGRSSGVAATLAKETHNADWRALRSLVFTAAACGVSSFALSSLGTDLDSISPEGFNYGECPALQRSKGMLREALGLSLIGVAVGLRPGNCATSYIKITVAALGLVYIGLGLSQILAPKLLSNPSLCPAS